MEVACDVALVVLMEEVVIENLVVVVAAAVLILFDRCQDMMMTTNYCYVHAKL